MEYVTSNAVTCIPETLLYMVYVKALWVELNDVCDPCRSLSE